MIENLDILYNVTGQSLVFDAPEGRPSSVTSSKVFESIDSDDGTEESALTGSATIETSPDTTLDGAASAQTHTIPLTATTGVTRGRRYIVTAANGDQEWVEVVEVSSGVSAIVRQPLINTYAASDTFKSTRVTHAIDATWVADETNVSEWNEPDPKYRWQLTYVVGGVTYRHAIFFDLVRYAGGYTATGLDVDNAFPGWLYMLPTYHREDQGAALIKEAYRQLKLDMYEAGKADQMARNREVVDDLVIHKAAHLGIQAALYAGGQVDPLAVEMARDRYVERRNNFINTAKLRFDHGGEGAARPTHAAPLFRR